MTGPRESVRRLATAVAGLAVVLGAAPAARAEAGDLSGRGESAFAEIAACAASADQVLAVIVVDESSSLRRTDPANERVGAIEAAIDSLAGVQAASGGKVSVEASLAVFSGSYTELVPWGVVSGAHSDSLLRAARSELPARNDGQHTDYRAALRGAQVSLAQRAATLGGTTCSVVLWFTDGQLDVPGNGESEAWRELCEANGLVDGLRGAGYPIVAVALGSQSAQWRDDLLAVAEGVGGSTTCGSTPVPAGAGALLRADEPSALRRLFAGVGALIQGGSPATSVRCPGAGCAGGSLSIPLDAGVSGLRVLLEGGADSAALFAPDGSRVALRPGSVRVADSEVTISSRDGLTVLSVDRPAAGAPATSWVLDTGTGAGGSAVVDVYYVWGAVLGLSVPDGLVVGEPSRVELSLRYQDGSPVDTAGLGDVALRLQAGGETVPVVWDGAGTATGALQVTAAAPVQLTAAASATGTASGAALAEARASLLMPATLPAAYPGLETATLDFGSLVGVTSAGGALRLVGAERGATRACLAASSLSGPTRAGDVSVGGPECVDIPAGAVVDWPFEISADAAADGSVNGSVTLSLTAVDGQTTDLELAVAAAMVRPVNEPMRWGIAAGLVAAGLLVPLIIGWLSNAMLGRFPVGPRTMFAVVPVSLSAGGPRRRDGGDLLRPDDFSYAGFSEPARVREVRLGDLRFRRSLPILPLRQPAAWFTSGEACELVASTDPRNPVVDGGRRARADFGLASLVYLALAPQRDSSGDFTGRLLCVGADEQGLADLVAAADATVAGSGPGWAEIHRRLTELDPGDEGAAAAEPDATQTGAADGGDPTPATGDGSEAVVPAEPVGVARSGGGGAGAVRAPSVFGSAAGPASAGSPAPMSYDAGSPASMSYDAGSPASGPASAGSPAPMSYDAGSPAPMSYDAGSPASGPATAGVPPPRDASGPPGRRPPSIFG